MSAETAPKSITTPLVRVDAFCRRYGEQVLVKNEAENPTRTWKDRRSRLIAEKARAEDVDKVVLVTAGNAGYSLAHALKDTSIEVVPIVDSKTSSAIKEKLREVCPRIVEIDLSQKLLTEEDQIALARVNPEEKIMTATDGWEKGYESLIEEIKDIDPYCIICPIGTGEGFVGIYDAMIKHGLTKTKLIGAEITLENKRSSADKLVLHHESPYLAPVRLRFLAGRGLVQIEDISDNRIQKAYRFARKYIDCEPSSAIVFAAAEAFKKYLRKADRPVVLVNSGKGLE